MVGDDHVTPETMNTMSDRPPSEHCSGFIKHLALIRHRRLIGLNDRPVRIQYTTVSIEDDRGIKQFFQTECVVNEWWLQFINEYCPSYHLRNRRIKYI